MGDDPKCVECHHGWDSHYVTERGTDCTGHDTMGCDCPGWRPAPSSTEATATAPDPEEKRIEGMVEALIEEVRDFDEIVKGEPLRPQVEVRRTALLAAFGEMRAERDWAREHADALDKNWSRLVDIARRERDEARRSASEMREALRGLLRFQPEEGRANRSHYAEHGMLCLCSYDGKGDCDCGWTEWKAAESRARALLAAPETNTKET